MTERRGECTAGKETVGAVFTNLTNQPRRQQFRDFFIGAALRHGDEPRHRLPRFRGERRHFIEDSLRVTAHIRYIHLRKFLRRA